MPPLNTLDYITLDVFTPTPFLGNPLAVVLVPAALRDLPQDTKQRIAREFNYSETTFLHAPSPPPSLSLSSKPGVAGTDDDGGGGGANDDDTDGDDHDARIPEWTLDIFLTDTEVPLAGHPVIGSAVHALTAAGARRGVFVTKAGRVRVELIDEGMGGGGGGGGAGGTGDGDADRPLRLVRAVIPHAVHLHRSFEFGIEELRAQQPRLARVLVADDSWGRLDVATLSIVRGMTFIFVKLPRLEALAAVDLFGQKPQAARLDDGWDVGQLMIMFYVEMNGNGDGVTRLRTRMIEGMFEDPATGSASCGLACLLTLRAGLEGGRTDKYEMTQAVEMGRRSDIGVDVEVAGKEIREVALKGTAVRIMEGKLRYE